MLPEIGQGLNRLVPVFRPVLGPECGIPLSRKITVKADPIFGSILESLHHLSFSNGSFGPKLGTIIWVGNKIQMIHNTSITDPHESNLTHHYPGYVPKR